MKKRRNRLDPKTIIVGIVIATVLFTEHYQQVLIGLVFVFLGIVLFLIFDHKTIKISNEDIKFVDRINGVQFERYVASLLSTNGYSRVKCTQTSNDYGADIIAYQKGEKIAIQCKRYNGSVGVSAVQEVLGAKSYYKAQKAIVVTNSRFTVNAVRLAKESNVIMWDRDLLLKLMGTAKGCTCSRGDSCSDADEREVLGVKRKWMEGGSKAHL